MRWMLCLSTLLLVLSACGGSGDVTQPVFPARPDGLYAAKLADCVREPLGEQRSCRLDELPLLGMEASVPDAEAIMQRVATTHSWMAVRFAQVLDQVPQELFTLTRSLAAIVIAADIRPSFYSNRTGAIYLDPANLWLTLDEKRSIDPTPDFRNDFGEALNFRIISRYVINNQYAWYSYSLDDDSQRSLADIVAPLSRLLFHELAHAGDFFPPDTLANLNSEQTVAAASAHIAEQGRRISQSLQASAPLQSDVMSGLARVNFLGDDPSSAQLGLDSEDVRLAFMPDGANDDYNYASQFEDVAMLFEEVMMGYSFGIDRDVAVTNRPDPDQPNIVHWGERRRIAGEDVAPRAKLIAQRLLPDADFTSYFASLESPQNLRNGGSWDDNLDPSAQAKAGRLSRGQLRGQRRELDLVLP